MNHPSTVSLRGVLDKPTLLKISICQSQPKKQYLTKSTKKIQILKVNQKTTNIEMVSFLRNVKDVLLKTKAVENLNYR